MAAPIFNTSPLNSSHNLTPIILSIAARSLKQPESRLKYISRQARKNTEKFGGMTQGWQHGDTVRYAVAPMMQGQILDSLNLNRMNDGDVRRQAQGTNPETYIAGDEQDIDTGDRRTINVRLSKYVNHQHALLAADSIYTSLPEQMRINMDAGRDALFNTAERWAIDNTYHLIPNVSLRPLGVSALSNDDMQRLGVSTGMKQDTLENLDPEPNLGAYGVLTDGRIRAAAALLEAFGTHMEMPALYVNTTFAAHLKADQRKQEPDALAMMGYSQGFISDSESIAGVLSCKIDYLPMHTVGNWGRKIGAVATSSTGVQSHSSTQETELMLGVAYAPPTYDKFMSDDRSATVKITGFEATAAVGSGKDTVVLRKGDCVRLEGVFDVVASSGDRAKGKARLPFQKTFSVLEDVTVNGGSTGIAVNASVGGAGMASPDVKLYPGPLFAGPHQNAFETTASAMAGTNGTGASLASTTEVRVIGAPGTSRTEVLMLTPSAFAIPMLPVGVLPHLAGLTMSQVTNQRMGLGMTVSQSGEWSALRNRTRFDLIIGAGATLSEYRSVRIPVDATFAGQQ